MPADGANAAQQATEPTVGVGPWPGGKSCWPAGEHFDPELLAEGDRRNVPDEYRYWTVAAIVADLDEKVAATARLRAAAGAALPELQVAIENLGHDFNIGSIVRSANGLGARHVHIIGRRRWNRRGAMVTDRYLHIHHHPTPEDFARHCQEQQLQVIGIDNLEGSVPLEGRQLPARCVLVLGEESQGISADLLACCAELVAITQYGSTRSLNVGAAAAIAMWAWAAQHLAGGR